MSLSDYVSKIIDMVDESGIDYRLNTMGTVLEGVGPTEGYDSPYLLM